jgi:hypothetical protein
MAHRSLKFEGLIQKAIEEKKVPGLAIAVIEGEQISAKVTLIIPPT